jgi:hypothetical protein
MIRFFAFFILAPIICFSQQNFNNPFKGFELVDTLLLEQNSLGVTLSEKNEILGIKINNRQLYFINSLPDSLIKYHYVLEKIEKEKGIKNIVQLGEYTLINNYIGYTVANLGLNKLKYSKSEFLKIRHRKWLYVDDTMPELKVFKDNLFVNAQLYCRNSKDYLDYQNHLTEFPEAMELTVVNDKLSLTNMYGIRKPDQLSRMNADFQRIAYFELDTIRNQVITGSLCEPELEVFSLQGKPLFTFGSAGKLITFDSVINVSSEKKDITKRKLACMNAALTKYNGMILDNVNNILIRSYISGFKIVIPEDSLGKSPSEVKGVCGVDTYFNELYNSTYKPEKGIQIYDLNSVPPKLIADINKPDFLINFQYARFDSNGNLLCYKFKSSIGDIIQYKYKLVFE